MVFKTKEKAKTWMPDKRFQAWRKGKSSPLNGSIRGPWFLNTWIPR